MLNPINTQQLQFTYMVYGLHTHVCSGNIPLMAHRLYTSKSRDGGNALERNLLPALDEGEGCNVCCTIRFI